VLGKGFISAYLDAKGVRVLEKGTIMKMDKEFWSKFDPVIEGYFVFFELIFNKPNGNING